MSETKTITIKGINDDDTLDLNPNDGNINVKKKDYVQIEIGKNSGVASIDGFTDDSTNSIFSDPPSSTNNWKGQIDENAAPGTYEDYTISVTASSSNQRIDFDPRITVNK